MKSDAIGKIMDLVGGSKHQIIIEYIKEIG